MRITAHRALPLFGDVLLLGLPAFVLSRTPILVSGDGDLAMNLVMGQRILDGQGIPVTDFFSYTRFGQLLVPKEWLSQLLFAGAYRAGALGGVGFLSALLISATFWLTFRTGLRRGASPILTLLLTLVGVIAAMVHWSARPHLFSWLCLAILLYLLTEIRQQPARAGLRWLIPPIFLFWANAHGGFLYGLIFLSCLVLAASLAAYAIVRRGRSKDAATTPSVWSRVWNGLTIRQYWLIPGCSLVATFVNPVGPLLWIHLLNWFRQSFSISVTFEYMSPNFHELGPQIFAALLLLTAFTFGRARRRVDWGELLVLCLAGYFALYSVRNIPIFVIVATPMLAEHATLLLPLKLRLRWKRSEPALGAFTPAGIVLALGLTLSGGWLGPLQLARFTFDPSLLPVRATDYLLTLPERGRIFNYPSWGGYLAFRLPPGELIYMDGRSDVFGDALVREFVTAASSSPGWDRILREREASLVLLPRGAPLVSSLRSSANWQIEFEDGTGVVFRRKDGVSQN